LNFSAQFSANWRERIGYLAGSDTDRAGEINSMFSDDSVDLVMASQGGWGCARILHLLDYEIIRANPKPFFGYSDLTACLNAIHLKTGITTFHVSFLYFFEREFLKFERVRWD
jgi:muramoyltetrapeptide carboxypeptidase